MESRLIGPGEAYLSARSPRVCGGAWRALECPGVDAEPWLVGGWALAIPIYGYREGGEGSTRYTTLPGTHLLHQPRVHPLPGTTDVPSTGTARQAVTALYRSTKEILGVDNAQLNIVY